MQKNYLAKAKHIDFTRIYPESFSYTQEALTKGSDTLRIDYFKILTANLIEKLNKVNESVKISTCAFY
jgi:hypothetical protein